MAFTDPQYITYDSEAVRLDRVLTGTATGKFVSTDSKFVMEFSTSDTKNRLHNVVRLQNTKITSDPLMETVNVRVGDTISLAVNRPRDGYSNQEVIDQILTLIAWLSANDNANLIKFVQREN